VGFSESVRGYAELMKVITASHPPRRFACRLNRRQKKCNQNSYDCNYDQKFNKRERRNANRFPA
jgi:hypothetical protein